jgi:branched-subunit amino acid transport protein
VNIWLVMVLAGMATFAIRLSFIALMDHSTMPPLVVRSLRYIPPAVLSAIIFPELFLHGGSFDLSLGNARLFAGLLAGAVAWRTRNAVLTIVVGMAAMWALTWLSAQF